MGIYRKASKEIPKTKVKMKLTTSANDDMGKFV